MPSKKRSPKIWIVGPGRLGASIAYSALEMAPQCQVSLTGRDEVKTQGIAADLREAYPRSKIGVLLDFNPPEKMDYTFLCFSGLRWKPTLDGNDRIIEARYNFEVIHQLAERKGLAQRLGTVLIVSNPVDLLVWAMQERFPEVPTYGFGLSLDAERFSRILSEEHGVKPKSLLCIGEHGASAVPLLTGKIPERRIQPSLYANLEAQCRRNTQEIVQKSNIPFFGPLRSLKVLLKALLLKKSVVIPLSAYLKTEWNGARGVAIGIPFRIQKGKITGPHRVALSTHENELWRETQKRIRAAYEKVKAEKK